MHRIFKIIIQAAGPKTSELFSFETKKFETILDIAYERSNWEIMLNIGEIKNVMFDEAYRKNTFQLSQNIKLLFVLSQIIN